MLFQLMSLLQRDGSFARAWYYDQQDEETQLALDSGELEYPAQPSCCNVYRYV